ncbi:MAG TPA: glycosyltransferase, partial [Pirellulaceae bacterium]|nr:glycosyltransferase [Pirellulaceae bacterium]
MPVGGAETLLAELVRRIDATRFRCEIVCLKQRGELGERLAAELPVTEGLLRHKYDLFVIARLRRLFLERDVAAVVTVGAGDKMFWGRIAAWLAGVPAIIAAIHSTGWPDRIGWLNRRLTWLTDAFVAVAPSHQRYLVEQERLPAARVTVIPNGVDTTRFTPRPKWPGRPATAESWLGRLATAHSWPGRPATAPQQAHDPAAQQVQGEEELRRDASVTGELGRDAPGTSVPGRDAPGTSVPGRDAPATGRPATAPQQAHDPAALQVQGEEELRRDAPVTDELRRDASGTVELGRDAPVTLAIVAALRPEKNHLLFVEAARLAVEQRPDARLLIIGDGPERPSIERAIRDAGLTEQVRLLGVRHDLPELLAACDVVTLTSRIEANPVSLLEAMAAGVPVVATRVGAVPDTVIHDVTGLLV